MYKDLEPKYINQNLDHYTIIDVREEFEYSEGHLKGAVNVPLSTFPSSFPTLPKNQALLIYCKSGIRSLSAAQELVKTGFTNIDHLKGGLIAWVKYTQETITVK